MFVLFGLARQLQPGALVGVSVKGGLGGSSAAGSGEALIYAKGACRGQVMGGVLEGVNAGVLGEVGRSTPVFGLLQRKHPKVLLSYLERWH